jgi:hypothetical protein
LPFKCNLQRYAAADDTYRYLNFDQLPEYMAAVGLCRLNQVDP